MAFETKGLRKILRVSWTAQKTNEWVLNKVGVKRELIDADKARKLAHCGQTTRKQGVAWRERDNARNNTRCTQARMTTDRRHQDLDMTPAGRINQNDGGQRYIDKVLHGVANPRIEDGERTEPQLAPS